ncbi:MAG: sigma-70 family RNA polymerase sigma factor [Acidimicrobiales bacterium]
MTVWDDVEQLYRDQREALVRLAGLLLDEPGDCEEVVQDAFIGLHLHRGTVAADKVPSYLRSAVLNAARSRLRRRRVAQRLTRVLPGSPPTPEDEAIVGDRRATVLAAVRRLPRRQQEVVVLRYWLDLSEADIAATLGITAGSVKVHASRGLAAVARTLGEDRDVEGARP